MIWQYGSGNTTAAMKALLKGTKLGSLSLLACGNHTCAPVCIDEDMQGHGLAPDYFSSWHNMLRLGCAADNLFQKGTQGVCVMLKCSSSTSVPSPKRSYMRQRLDVEVTSSEPKLLMRSEQAPTFC